MHKNNKPILLKNIRVIDASQNLDQEMNITVKNGIISYFENSKKNIPFNEKDFRSVNCKDKILSSGIFDLRVYLNETNNENVSILKNAAVKSGVLKMGILPFQKPLLDNPVMIEHLIEKTNFNNDKFFYPYGGATKELKGNEIAELGLMAEVGAIGFTDAPNCIQDSLVMRRVMSYAKMLEKPILQNPEDRSLAGLTASNSTTIQGEMNEGEVSTRLGLVGIPSCAEVMIVERDLRLAELTGVHYHVSNVSTKETVEVIKRAKLNGIKITCDTSPPYFSLNELELSTYDTSFKLSPPLRNEEDRIAIQNAIFDDTIDVITSDHKPMSNDTKILPFTSASTGASGIETLLPLTLNLLNKSDVSIMNILKKITLNPSKLLKVEISKIKSNEKANFIIFDPNEQYLINKDLLQTSPTPFHGRPVQGKNYMSMMNGEIVFDNLDLL